MRSRSPGILFLIVALFSLQQAIAEAALADAGKGSASPTTSRINTPGKSAYPISSYSWIYVPAVARDPARGAAVAEFLKWTHASGQTVAEHLGYATLPHGLASKLSAEW